MSRAEAIHGLGLSAEFEPAVLAPSSPEQTEASQGFLAEAFAAQGRGEIKEWAVNFLERNNNSQLLAKKLRLTGRAVRGPELVRLDELIPVCGPDPPLAWYEEPERYWKKVEQFAAKISKGHQPAPIMAGRSRSGLYVNDGTHTLEALKQLGFEDYYMVSWQMLRQPVRDRLGLEGPSGRTTNAIKTLRQTLKRS